MNRPLFFSGLHQFWAEDDLSLPLLLSWLSQLQNQSRSLLQPNQHLLASDGFANFALAALFSLQVDCRLSVPLQPLLISVGLEQRLSTRLP